MKPSLYQLHAWIDHQNLELTQNRQACSLTKHSNISRDVIIDHITVDQEAFTHEEKTERLELACNRMAYALCVVPPIVALSLNHQVYRNVKRPHEDD